MGPPSIGAVGLPLETTAPLPEAQNGKSARQRDLVSLLLSLCLILFIADAVASLVDDSLIVLFASHSLAAIRGLIFCLAMLIAIVVYVLMGITPMIPKKLFLPVVLFNPAAALLLVPLLIYFYPHIEQISCAISLAQLICALWLLAWLQGGFKLQWPLVPEKHLRDRTFSWLNLSTFAAANVFVMLPAVLIYLGWFAALAVNHFSDGFLALRLKGLTVQVRKYARTDGKTIQLVPMSHVGEPDFYRKLTESFPVDSTILMEGVTDNRNLLTNRISYKRMAKSLGLAPQEKEFRPQRVEIVRADVDVEEFTPETIGFLNLVMLIHVKGVNSENLLKLIQYSPPPHFEERLFDDLLKKRNKHVLQEIHSRLSDSEHLIVPWGAAHMPGIAKGVQESGFRLTETQEYVAIRFKR
jgi:hypothetical protein